MMELHGPVALPHHVNEPDVSDTAPMLQFTTPAACEHGAVDPTYVTPVGTVSYTFVSADVTLGRYVVKLSYESCTDAPSPVCWFTPGLQSV
jgi:hypothetical protein